MDIPLVFLSREPTDKTPTLGNLNSLKHKMSLPSTSSPKPSSTPARHKSNPKLNQKPKPKQNPEKVLEIDPHDVPVPAPDTGLSSTLPSIVRTGILPIISHAPTTLTVPPAAHTLIPALASLSHLSPLATLTSLSTTATPSVTVIPKDTSRALGANQYNHDPPKAPTHTHIIIAVLVAVGLLFMFLSVFVYWRWCNRPRRRTCPTPSLPIFQDPFADHDLKDDDDESLFGGKDNGASIARPPSNGIYPWVQYTPRPSDPSPTAISKSPKDSLAVPKSALVSENSTTPVRIHLPVNTGTKSPTSQPIQQMQNALTRAASRVSAMSASIYPTSPQSNYGIGIAIGGASPLTGDGTPILTRKSSKDRASISTKTRQSFRHSLAATEYLDVYAGAITSPTQPPQTAVTPIKSALRKSPLGPPAGRARIQAGYTPGTANAALRASSTVAGITTLPRNAGNRSSLLAPSEEVPYLLPPLSPALKTDARRERDTRALTTALGLTTPSPPAHESFMPSPATTLHPDDSITLAGGRDTDRARLHAKPVPASNRATHIRTQSEAPMSPGTEASARLGNLMLAEFTSMVSLPSTRAVVAPSASVPAKIAARPAVARKTANAGGGGRADDQPPRVPSPPPLPSLAQMAMAHANQQAYEDYRSPTYSIYGLYEAERKSRAQGALDDF